MLPKKKEVGQQTEKDFFFGFYSSNRFSSIFSHVALHLLLSSADHIINL
jgi:hypothetical protein